MQEKETKIVSIDKNKKSSPKKEIMQCSKGIEKRVKHIYFDSLKEIDDLLNTKLSS